MLDEEEPKVYDTSTPSEATEYVLMMAQRNTELFSKLAVTFTLNKGYTFSDANDYKHKYRNQELRRDPLALDLVWRRAWIAAE